MNKIYAYKYSEISGGLIAVSELTSRKTKKRKRIMTIVLSFALYSGSALASHMDITNFYSRDFFDFGQKLLAKVRKIALKSGILANFFEFLDIPDLRPGFRQAALFLRSDI